MSDLAPSEDLSKEIELLKTQLGDVQVNVDGNTRKIEELERRSLSRYLRVVNANEQVIPTRGDWLCSFKTMLIDMKLTKKDDVDKIVHSVIPTLTRAKAGTYVVEVSEALRKRLMNPSREVRSLIEAYCVSKKLPKEKPIKFFPSLTKMEDSERSKLRYYLNALIGHYKNSNVSDRLAKMPLSGKMDRIVIEPRIKGEGWSKEIKSLEEVCEIIGTTFEKMESERIASLSGRMEKISRKRVINGDGNDREAKIPKK